MQQAGKGSGEKEKQCSSPIPIPLYSPRTMRHTRTTNRFDLLGHEILQAPNNNILLGMIK